MKHRLTTIALLLAAVSGATAQEGTNAQSAEAAQGRQVDQGIRLEIRPFAGRYIPTGRMSDEFKGANMFGAQAAVELNSHVHILGSLGYTDGTSTIEAFNNGATKVWQYDGGVEVNALKTLGSGWLLRPFAGAGAGARTYSYQETSVTSSTCMTGYAAFGSELQKSVLAFRLEGRGYVNCFKQPFTSEKSIRSDAMIAFGVAYHIF